MEFSKRDILSALGLESENTFWTAALAGFGVGCIVGAAVAVMVTPKSGPELRADLMDRTRDLQGKARDMIAKGKEEIASLNIGNGSKSTTSSPTY